MRLNTGEKLIQELS